ncbi:MAG TPA: hypothetical protein VGJ84_21900 [Polyangiaceae bacterium]
MTNPTEPQPSNLDNRVKRTIDEITGQAESMRLMAKNLEDVAAELEGAAPSDELRQTAQHVRACALHILVHAAAVCTRAGTLEAFGEVRGMADHG